MMTVNQADALGQLLCIELEDDAWSASLERRLRSQRPGGVVFSLPRPPGVDDVAALLTRITTTLGFVPFFALEEDGGRQGLLRRLLPPLPSPCAAARAGVPAAGRLGDLVGAGMKLLGFNTNLAPVLDLLTPFSEAILGPRAFGVDAQKVTKCAQAFVRGLTTHRVLACGKHFPGLGGAQLTAGSTLPVVGKSMAELWREDLVSYRGLMGELPFVLLSYCAYKAYDLDVLRPAAVSPSVVEGLLRAKLGYGGLAIADLRPPGGAGVSPACGVMAGSLALSPKSQQAGDTPALLGADLCDAASQPLVVGCDILITSAEAAEKVLAGLRKALEVGRLSPQRVGESLERVRATRRRLARPRGRVSTAAVDQLAKCFQRFSRECRTAEQKIA